ncbi:MAG: hypothetical protein LBB21_01915 [Holosporaceae bacterium]|jgi:hypothetical protein|nr:hypothetical protein [Holosporaceae bacterium]
MKNVIKLLVLPAVALSIVELSTAMYHGDCSEHQSGARSSIWLSDLPDVQERSVDGSYFGIFTRDPKEIAERLPRPLTPFVPTPSPKDCDFVADSF